MVRTQISSKHLQITKANTTITATLAIAAFVTVASLVASRSMLQQRAYNSKVIKEKETAVKILKENVTEANTLVISYQEFVGRPQNIIGGNKDGTGERDGDNAKIILDALPSRYDFPALATSLEKILTQGNFSISNISGTDDEIAQAVKNSPTPEIVEIPFTFSVGGSYDALNGLISTIERSIRPIQINKLSFSISTGTIVEMEVDAKTFYQSEKNLNITKKVIQQ